MAVEQSHDIAKQECEMMQDEWNEEPFAFQEWYKVVAGCRNLGKCQRERI